MPGVRLIAGQSYLKPPAPPRSPYRDGNKRIGFLALVTFLGVNGVDFLATDADVVVQIVALAEGRVSEDALADWIRKHSSKRR